MQDHPPFFQPPAPPAALTKPTAPEVVNSPLPVVELTPAQSRPLTLSALPVTTAEKREEPTAKTAAPHPTKSAAAGRGRSRSVKTDERDKLSRSYTPAYLPLMEIMQDWRARKPLTEVAERNRRLFVRALLLFKPEEQFNMTVFEFRKRYVEVGNARDAIDVLADMNSEKLLCYGTSWGEFVHMPSMDSLSVNKARIYLSAEGVQAWTKAVVDNYRSVMRANPNISGLMTQYLVGFSNEVTPG